MYSQTKHDIINLRLILVLTRVKGNHAIFFQRFWPIDKGVESFKIRPPTLHSNFTVGSKNPLHRKICKRQKNMTPSSFGNEYLLLIYFSYVYSEMGSSLYFNAFNKKKKQLDSDSKKFPGKMTGIKPHLLFHGHQ